MDKIISNGTEVLIFSESKNNDSKILEKKKSIKGVIISSKKSEDLSYHGSPWYEQIYTVLGYNGKTYEATYGSSNSLIGNVYILTVDHYIKYINHLIEENNKKMIDLQTLGLLALSFYGSIQSQDAKKRTQIASVFCVHFTFSGWSQDSITTLSSCTSST